MGPNSIHTFSPKFADFDLGPMQLFSRARAPIRLQALRNWFLLLTPKREGIESAHLAGKM